MKTVSPPSKKKTSNVKDYISVIENASELFELYNANLQLEILKSKLLKKRGLNSDDDKIMAEINLATKLQDVCRRRV